MPKVFLKQLRFETKLPERRETMIPETAPSGVLQNFRFGSHQCPDIVQGDS